MLFYPEAKDEAQPSSWWTFISMVYKPKKMRE
jgi:hypothetical protein